MAVQGAAYASNIIHDYEFSWTIDNFSLSPDLMRGPPFSPLPGFPENLCIELKYEQCETYMRCLKMSLIDLNIQDRNLTVSSSTSFRNSNDVNLKDEDDTSSSKKFKGSGSILLMEYIEFMDNGPISKLEFSKAMNLLEDKLIVKGKISFSDYEIASSVSSLMVKEESEAWEEVLKDLKTVYESGSSSDITFSVGAKTLRAHKLILRSRSPVFAKMFDSDMLESNSNNVVIEDADFHAFNCFLMFLYTGIVEDKKLDTVHSLYSLAHKYQVNSLHAICSRILGKSLTIASACSVLVLSDLHADQELKDVAKGFIRRHLFQIAGTEEWVELVTTKPQLVKEVLA